MTTQELAAAWLAAKRDEQAANARRLEIEADILKQCPAKEEGSTTHELANGWKVKATGKLTYKADIDALLRLTESWPEKPVKVKTEADESMLKAIRAERPDLWRAIAPAITVKPAKTALTVEVPDGV